jgi:acyl-CoA thioester hydrolase
MPAENLITFRVRYQETDRMETVYHANYLVYFEMGRTEFMREQGICYREMEQDGFAMVVVEAGAHFRASARYDDLVSCRTTLPAYNAVSVKFEYSLHLGEGTDGPLLCDGYTILAFLGRDRRPARMSERYRDAIIRSSGGEKLVRRA